MSGGRIARHECGRLILLGQACMCQPRPSSRCDCTHDGNREHQGPTCRQRELDAWTFAVTNPAFRNRPITTDQEATE